MSDRGLIAMLCRNSLHYSRACLKTLQAQNHPCDILVVNNASSDGTGSWVRAEQAKDSNLYAMHFPEVRSVAECWNRALGWAWKRGHNEALVVNNDTEFLPETFAALLAFKTSDYVQDVPGMTTCVSVRERSELVWDGTYAPRPHPDFSAFMLARWAHELVPFDESYEGAYCEDCDLHVRMHRRGIRAVNLGIPFLHHASGTLKDADPVEQRRIERCASANRERFRAKYGCVPGTQSYSELFK